MPYKNSKEKISLIWDGTDEGITSIEYNFDCPICNFSDVYVVKDLKDVETLDKNLLNYMMDKNLISSSDWGFSLKANIPAYVIEKKCCNCKSMTAILIGVKEIQPQRYQIYRKSIVYKMQ